VIGWQRGAATNVTRCRPITAAHGVLPLLREEFALLKLILHSELRGRAASRRALPCPSSFTCDRSLKSATRAGLGRIIGFGPAQRLIPAVSPLQNLRHPYKSLDDNSGIARRKGVQRYPGSSEVQKNASHYQMILQPMTAHRPVRRHLLQAKTKC